MCFGTDCRGGGLGEYFGLPAVRWLGVAVVVAMIIEMVAMMSRNRAKLGDKNNLIVCAAFLAWLLLMLASVYAIGNRPWIILLLLLIISAAISGPGSSDACWAATRCGSACQRIRHGPAKLQV